MSTGVVVMSYGTPAAHDEIAAFYTDVRRGRPPSPEQLAELERRYEAIGGLSPLHERSAEQLQAIEHALERLVPGRFVVRYGTKHGHPSIEDAVDALAAGGADGLVGLVLAPHFSALSVGEYLERLARRAVWRGIAKVAGIERFGTLPALVEAWAERVRSATSALRTRAAVTEVLFSAHSLPARILDEDDPYPSEVRESAALVAAAVPWGRYRAVWQSASLTGESWLGPDIGVVLEELAASDVEAVVACPVGFTSDHLEVLYDLDVLAAGRAGELGLSFSRCGSLNDEPSVMEALAELVLAADPVG